MSKCLMSKFKFENLKTGVDLCLVSTLNKKTKKNNKGSFHLFLSIFLFLHEAYNNLSCVKRTTTKRHRERISVPLILCHNQMFRKCMHYQMLCSTFHTNARSPSIGLSLSSFLRRRRRGSTCESSTTVNTALFIDGQACEPRCGSPVFVPRPPTCSTIV